MSGWLRRVLLGVLALMPAAVVHAHEMSMAEMELREVSRGEFIWQWGAGDKRPASEDLTPVWPEGCRNIESNAVHCGESGMTGTLSIDGVGKRYSAALVKLTWLDGQTRVYTLTAAQSTVHLFGSADDKRGLAQIASAYTVLGIEHILTGWDHLMFVVGLLFLVGFNRRLLLTITAFTAAHSLTLACSALGLLTLRPPPVEATIALSIMLVAGEALRGANASAQMAGARGLSLRPGARARLRGRLERDRPARQLPLGRAAHLQCRRGDRPIDDGRRRVGALPHREGHAGDADGAPRIALHDRDDGGVLVVHAHRGHPRLTRRPRERASPHRHRRPR
ncbi:HupE/UreJ family protein [Variovorax sp. J2P1-59]|uniref:HupE/UreJ family protein n=1 Tax=Variovorax flavidus TaxID=3053501 RepID=UPI0025790EB5|nr:HupE/UreJ family protein [Variovorax sp. J2P1-59]MDM0078461.1 HupE/UreJ family protein [Variovorax sp. J2P1-59]